MRNLPVLRAITVTLLVTLLAACSSDLVVGPISGGNVIVYSRGAVAAELTITKKQAVAASEWMTTHQVGWERDFGDYAPDVLAFIKHSDGTSAGLYVYPEFVVYVSGYNQRSRRFPQTETTDLVRRLGVSEKLRAN